MHHPSNGDLVDHFGELTCAAVAHARDRREAAATLARSLRRSAIDGLVTNRALLVGLLVWSVGLCLGGSTGYAINPARDLGPRIAHALLPVAGKGGGDWGYAWIPVAGPILGGIIGAWVFKACW